MKGAKSILVPLQKFRIPELAMIRGIPLLSIAGYFISGMQHINFVTPTDMLRTELFPVNTVVALIGA